MYVGYVRVSHVGGRSGESFRSPEDQANAIRDWAARAGQSVEILAPELDESGGNPDRAILREAVEGVEAGRWQGIVVAYLSRLSRSTRHLLDIWTRIEAAGGRVVAVAENLDTSTPAGRMQRTILAAVAEHELDVKSEHFRALQRSAVERGLWKFRQVPLGYRLAGPRPTGLEPGPDAGKVRKAFAARMAGEPVSRIAVELGMTPNGVRMMFANRVYLGEIAVGDDVNVDAHEAIIDRETFDAVQSLRRSRPARSATDPSLLAGLIRCVSCGHIMRRGSVSYSCHGQSSAGMCPAPTAITISRIEPFVEQAVRAELDRWQITHRDRTDESDRLHDELAKARDELAAYLEATQAAGLAIEDYAAGARLRREAVDDAQRALDAASRVVPIAARLDGGGAIWDSLAVGEQNRLLRGLLDAVVVAPVGRGQGVPVGERVRLFLAGTLSLGYAGGGIAMGIQALPFPQLDDERLMRVPRGEDAGESGHA